ncbi:hypothetical protein D6C84_09307 [Aureobasidium pullulans]|uniref:RBR-type E3 ubiquitin transferase n=1 Tax=Aureobasidium pullulans TaxID=5580 RepID=A0A4S9X7U9_AURPU|nr:hypothetical protein D6C84_09307 [Aureobasidium pullulans]
MSTRALVDERIPSSPYHSLDPNTDMAFLYESENSDLAKLIIRFQREDIGDVARDDEELSFALELQLQELSIAETLIADHQFLNELLGQIDRDRKFALVLSGVHQEADAALLTCTGCDSRFTRHQSFKAPCDRHFFCFECLANFFEYTIGDESLYPPKCCDTEISLDNVKKLLDDKLVARYEKKKIEYDTEPTKRTYCHGPKCNTFIPESSIEKDVATCSDCGKRTCTICKEKAHRGDCPKDEDTQSLLDMAEKEGWQRCYNTKCHRVVALTIGCNHITCRCGAQFCYICGARWKTCLCPHMNEAYLLAGNDRPRNAEHRLFQPPQD